jgi:hypothetical protein
MCPRCSFQRDCPALQLRDVGKCRSDSETVPITTSRPDILTNIELGTTMPMSWKTRLTRRPCKNGIKVLQNALKLAPRTDITIDPPNAATQPRTIIGCLQTLIRCLMFPISYLGLPLRQSSKERQVKSAADVVLVAIDMENLQSLMGTLPRPRTAWSA